MSPKLEELLRSAGWSHERLVSTSEWAEMLKKDGFELIPRGRKGNGYFWGPDTAIR